MNRRERLMATLSGKPVDRPAVNFYEIGGFKVDPSNPDKFNIYNDPSWKPLLDLAEENTDLTRMCSAVRSHSHEAWQTSKSGREDTKWSDFFANLKFIVIDEVHAYRGIFGSNIANVIRRRPRARRLILPWKRCNYCGPASNRSSSRPTRKTRSGVRWTC